MRFLEESNPVDIAAATLAVVDEPGEEWGVEEMARRKDEDSDDAEESEEDRLVGCRGSLGPESLGSSST